MASPNVLRVNVAEEQTAYRDAVAEIMRRVQADHGVTLLEISERIDVSLGTVSNAANKKNDLNPIYLQRIGKAFGAHCLDPYARMAGGRIVPLASASDRDILPFIQRVGLKVAKARDPHGPGGEREIHTERLGYLPALRDLKRELIALIEAIEGEAETLRRVA